MFRKEFVEFVTKAGMVSVKEIRPLLNETEKEVITELKLLDFDAFDDVKFGKLIAKKTRLPFLDLSRAKIGDDTLTLLPRAQIIQYRAIPIQKNDKAVTLAIYDPTVTAFVQQISAQLKQHVELIITNIGSWKKLFERVGVTADELATQISEVKGGDKASDEIIKEEDIGEDIVILVNKILAECIVRGASDIHVEPYEKTFRVRLRVDGSLVEVMDLPKQLIPAVISRMKIMSQLDISEKRKPQDGRLKIDAGGKVVDFRVNSLPTLFGEKICMRILDSSSLEVDMTKLGFEQKQLEIFKDCIHQPFGMVVVTGPTGSGKTTTLYSALAELNTDDTNLSTAEDPVEFNLKGINQVNVRKEIGLTFAAALKAFLRQDPDVIMVGEIRDLEVGEIAIEAALTGHMVLSTLHTNDAPSTINRLLNMGIEPFMVTAALQCVVAQRLCRRICVDCKVVDTSVTKELLVRCGIAAASAEKLKVYKGKGCEKCGGKGYKGRVAIHEVLRVSLGIREAIIAGATADEIKKVAIKEGMKTLRMSALTKVAQGLTSLEEAISNSSADD